MRSRRGRYANAVAYHLQRLGGLVFFHWRALSWSRNWEKHSARKRPPRPRSAVKDRPRSGTRPKSGTRRPGSAAKYRPKSATKQPSDGSLDDLAREMCALRQPSR